MIQKITISTRNRGQPSRINMAIGRNAAISGAQHHLVLAVCFAIFLVANPLCSASQDPALCPFELGYSPTFSDDGAQLFCNKGSESFLVDPDGTNAIALRDVGMSVKQLSYGALMLSEQLFCKYTDPEAVFYLPDGTPTKDGDPALGAFLFSFKFPPGIDVNGIFDVSNFQYLGGSPPKVHVDWRIYTLNFDVRFDTILRLDSDEESDEKIWKQYILVTARTPK